MASSKKGNRKNRRRSDRPVTDRDRQAKYREDTYGSRSLRAKEMMEERLAATRMWRNALSFREVEFLRKCDGDFEAKTVQEWR